MICRKIAQKIKLPYPFDLNKKKPQTSHCDALFYAFSL
ncbi:hypothetical protein Y59_41200 [Enterobacter hormaechei]|nr:hypothetical protein CSB67_1529 [Enterobacter hormaechei]KAF0678113.1 hypothetical protein Y59_41200 [Enterobacter hormaechei]